MTYRRKSVLTDAIGSTARSPGVDVVIMNESFTGGSIQPSHGHIGSDHLRLLGVPADAESNVLSVI